MRVEISLPEYGQVIVIGTVSPFLLLIDSALAPRYLTGLVAIKRFPFPSLRSLARK
jgi:hypothetical protein